MRRNLPLRILAGLILVVQVSCEEKSDKLREKKPAYVEVVEAKTTEDQKGGRLFHYRFKGVGAESIEITLQGLAQKPLDEKLAAVYRPPKDSIGTGPAFELEVKVRETVVEVRPGEVRYEYALHTQGTSLQGRSKEHGKRRDPAGRVVIKRAKKLPYRLGGQVRTGKIPPYRKPPITMLFSIHHGPGRGDHSDNLSFDWLARHFPKERECQVIIVGLKWTLAAGYE